MTSPRRRGLVAAAGLVVLLVVPSAVVGSWWTGISRGMAGLLWLRIATATWPGRPVAAGWRRPARFLNLAASTNLVALVALAAFLPATHAVTFGPALPQVLGVVLLLAAAASQPRQPLPRTERFRVVTEIGTAVLALLALVEMVGLPLTSAGGMPLALLSALPCAAVVYGLNRCADEARPRATMLGAALLLVAVGGSAYQALAGQPVALQLVAGGQMVALPLLLVLGVERPPRRSSTVRVGGRLLPDLVLMLAIVAALALKVVTGVAGSNTATVLLVAAAGLAAVRHLRTTVRVALDNQALEEQVAARTSELELAASRTQAVLDLAPVGLAQVDAGGRLRSANPTLCALLGLPPEDLGPDMLVERVLDPQLHAVLAGERTGAEGQLGRTDGEAMVVRMQTTPDVVLPGQDGGSRILVVEDMTERRRMALDLEQASRLEAVGRLDAGVAHEINTPIQFVGDNLAFLDDAMRTLLRWHEAPADAPVDAGELTFLQEEVPEAIRQSQAGVERVAKIVAAMKVLGHMDGTAMQPADLNAAIADTVLVARGETKHIATVELDLQELPLVTCHVASLGQVVLNLLVNAVHAIAEQDRSDGHIVVSTRATDGWVEVTVADDGPGIPHDVLDRIFDAFFTTKPVGRGTGQGLAMARATLRDHQGTIEVDTCPGVGTAFILRLPVTPPTDIIDPVSATPVGVAG